MQSWAESQAQLELHNPTSPYFIGQPTVPDQIRQYLNGTCKVNCAGYYNTNYFGSGKKSILARPTTDSVEIMGKVKQRNKFNSMMSLLGTGIAATVGFFLLRKIPGSGKVAKMAFDTTKFAVKTPFVGIWKFLRWLPKRTFK